MSTSTRDIVSSFNAKSGFVRRTLLLSFLTALALGTLNAQIQPESTQARFGLGAETRVGSVESRWPGGITQTVTGPVSHRFHTVDQSVGSASAKGSP